MLSGCKITSRVVIRSATANIIWWGPKYRYQVLGGDVGLRYRELLREIARSEEMIIYAGSANRAHIHKLIGIPPQLLVSKRVQYLIGNSSHELVSEFQQLTRRYCRQHLWARGHWAASSGNLTDEMWKEYIRNQTPPGSDDGFEMV